MIYTLKQGNKTIGVQNNHKWYIIGFPNITHARAIHYNIAPEPNIVLLKNNPKKSQALTVCMNSSIFIPKHQGDHWHPMNDGNFHIQAMNINDFNKLVYCNLGIIYAYNLKHEDSNEFTFDAHVFSPP